MSVSVTLRTKNIIEPDLFLKYLADNGEQIVATSVEYPSVKFGTEQMAIRGVEVNEMDNGLEIRACAFASTADYQLFAKVIDALMKLTGDKAYMEDDDDNEIINPLELFDDEWIISRQDSYFNLVRTLINNGGDQIVMFGLFCKFCLGPNFFSNFDIPLNGDSDAEDVDNLLKYLCRMQNLCAGLKDTSTRMEIPSPSGDPGQGLTISLIGISNGKVTDFDYISEADLLAIIDTDDKSKKPVLIPFNEAWKVLPNDIFAPLDELQYKRLGELTVDMAHEMMERGRHLQPDDIHYKPTYPGAGFDDKQHTFILMWNPDISSVSLEDHNLRIKDMFTEYFNWSIWEHEKAKCGDRFFLVRVGKGNRGIVMSGIFDSHPYEANDWSGKGRRVFYMDMIPNVMINPNETPMVTTDELLKAIPSFDWTGGHSGRILSQEDASKLEILWADFLDRNRDMADGVNFKINHHVTFL